MRAFLAVPVEEPALGEVRRLLVMLQERVPGVRWAPAETPHLTVHFFGSIADPDADRAVNLLDHAPQSTTPFPITLDRLGAFPRRGDARVLWLGPSAPPEQLISLEATCGATLAAAGFEVESREYRPHCTLGRPRQPWTGAAAWQAVSIDHAIAATFIARRLVLYQSVTGPSGAVHTPVRELPFTPVQRVLKNR